MTRTTRVRTFTIPSSPGSRDTFFKGTSLESSKSTEALKIFSCSDSHGRPVADSALNIVQRDTRGYKPMSGTVVSGSYSMSCQDFIPTAFSISSLSDCAAVASVPSAGGSMLDLHVRTNPSRPGKIVPLTLIQDLLDIPKMLREAGRLYYRPTKLLNPREIANKYLVTEFGWLPLIEDLRNLLEVGSSIDQRFKELNRLYSGKGLRRRVRLGNWSFCETSRVAGTYYGPNVVYSNVSTSTLVERWGTIRWKPSWCAPHNPSDADMFATAKRLAWGLTPEALYKGAWDILPWTWIIQWFTNVGSLALQFSNTVPATPSSACIMTEMTTMKWIALATPLSGITGGSGLQTRVTKSRYVGSSSLTAHLPILDGWRLSILAALFVQRLKR
jgi:hypothetical protein